MIGALREMLSYPFMVNALRAGTIAAVVAGAIGYVMVLRREAFAAHTLAVASFPGAAGATWLGVSASLGYFGACIAGALALAAVPGRRVEPAATGTLQAVALGAGLLFVSLYRGYLSGLTNLLFGSITGITAGQVRTSLVAGVVCLVALGALARPLLFASLDPDVARARRVPVRWVSAAFLVLLGVAAAGAGQVTGSLLVFALLVLPPATAARLSARPAVALLLSVVLAVVVVWTGETLAFFTPYPIGFWITTVAFALFLLSRLRRRV